MIVANVEGGIKLMKWMQI